MLALFARLSILLLGCALGAHLIGLMITNGRDLIDQVKGEIDGWWALTAAYAIRLPALFVLLGIIGALGQSAYLAEVESQTRAYWDDADDAVTLGISGSLSDSEYYSAQTSIVEMSRALDKRHGVVFTQRDPLSPALPNALAVNEEYLQRVIVLGTDGERITATNGITVLVPSGSDAAATASAAADWYAFQHSLTSSDVPEPEEVRIFEIEPDQELFTFRTGSGDVMNGPAVVHDAAIVVIPGLDHLAPSEIFAGVTNGGIVFTDPAAVTAAVHSQGLDHVVAAIQPVAYQADERYRQALGTVTINVAGFVASVIVVTGSALIVAVVSVEKNKQRLFVQHISGWPFLAAHRGALIIESVLIAAVAAISVVATWTRDPLSVRTVVDRGTASTENYLVEQSVIAVAVCITASGLLVGALALAHRRMVRRHSADS